MQFRTRILKDFARCRKPFRVRPDGKILHEQLRPVDQRKHISRGLWREEFLTWHDQIHWRCMSLHHELPGCDGTEL